MPRVVYSPAAGDDLVDIAGFIAHDKPSAARKWVSTLRDRCELLAMNPDLGEQRPGFGVVGCRCFGVGNYVIFYRAVDNGIEVARIVHGSRDLENL
jgi:toxin ParE1/3/4